VGVSLSKGGNVSLSKAAPGLTAALVGLGWDVRTTTGTDYDLDASALLLDASGKVLSDRHFVFYNNLTSPDGSVEHTGDNLTGEDEGDDESVKVNLAAVPAEVDRIVCASRSTTPRTGARASARSATPSSAWSTRRAAPRSPATTCPRTPTTETAMVFGELYRNGARGHLPLERSRERGRKFRAVGQGYASGPAGIAADFGVNV
jgi:tellurium resistance protein TerD